MRGGRQTDRQRKDGGSLQDGLEDRSRQVVFMLSSLPGVIEGVRESEGKVAEICHNRPVRVLPQAKLICLL